MNLKEIQRLFYFRLTARLSKCASHLRPSVCLGYCRTEVWLTLDAPHGDKRPRLRSSEPTMTSLTQQLRSQTPENPHGAK
ncbi:hypothetical protein X963_5504 [Burkholderia pseudomallei MSHR7498]|nr:hypothetical protein X990_5622 [Burkholderia pseudomallei MSHR4868]KGS73333.1 hypothetical protein X942_5762 [Burkholderia pseudomallei MSHR5596]KGS92036.1 hypothetical protein X963_5504 [Burkholderia pseudomallei MSHR7498]